MHSTDIKTLLKIFMLITITLGAISCSTTSRVSRQPEASQQVTAESIIMANDFERNQQWLEAATLYRHLADQSAQPQRSRFLQKTALMLYRSGRIAQVEDFYNSLNDDDILPAEQVKRSVLLAGVYFDKGKTYQSLGNLPDINSIEDPVYKALALKIRSQGVLAIGKPLESARLRIQIGKYLSDENDIVQNQQFIWDALNRISEPKVIKALSQQQSPALRGWLELNLIARRSDMLPAKIEPWVKKWHELYGDHEAAISFADALVAESKLIYIEPSRIALMLPFSGKLKNVSKAIQNGFLYGYYQDNEDRPALEIINVSADPAEFFLQYNQAQQNGADFIVGPLDKKLVNELILTSDLKTPTLTLNYADDENRGVNNLYQFGLRPEDEAEQIADYALNSEKYHAITLTPDTTLGNRLQGAFSNRFERLGGQVVGAARYPARNNDYSPSIKQLLNINSSNRRHSILDTVLGRKTEFIPRRRQDIDMIFIAGNPRQARLIKPQLKFHHAIDLPVYATSSISSSINNPDADRDLNGILFIDTPWALQNDKNPDFAAIHKLWPTQSERYAKFFALGLDAYKMIPSLRRLLINPQEKIALNSGTVSLDAQGRVHRELLFATYRKGRIELLEPPGEKP
jgi:outer membrane PBP1 activator LpoA protein